MVRERKVEIVNEGTPSDVENSLASILAPQEKKSIETASFNAMSDMTSKEKSSMLSEISDNEVKILTKLSMIGHMRNKAIYGHIVEKFMLLRLSKNRASRSEILTALQNLRPEKEQNSLSQLRQVFQ